MHSSRNLLISNSLVSTRTQITYFILNTINVVACQKRQCSNAGVNNVPVLRLKLPIKQRIKQGQKHFEFVESFGDSASGTNASKPHSSMFTLVKEEVKPDYVSVKKYITNIGMPRGYPSTCASGYSRFFYLHITAAFFHNFSMSIATQALLCCFFAESTPQVWMIKDLAPSLVAAYLANRVASYELRPKYWLMISIFMNQTAVLIDLLIPGNIPPELYLAAAIATSVIKQNAFLMHFVSRASLLQHFATHKNLGEIQKKFNSFGMVIFTIASAMGILLTTYTPSFYSQLAVVLLSSLISIGCTYFGIKHVSFCVLTAVTAQLSFQSYLTCPTAGLSKEGTPLQRFSSVLSTEEVNYIVGFEALIPQKQIINDIFVVNPKLETLKMTMSVSLKDNTGVPISDEKENFFKFEGTLLQHRHLHFTIGLWEEVGVKGKTKLVLLVHTTCDAYQLYGALLMCYESIRIADVFLKEGKGCHQKWEKSIRSFFSHELQDSFQRTMEKSPNAFRQAYYSAQKDRMTLSAAKTALKAERMKMNMSENICSSESEKEIGTSDTSGYAHHFAGNYFQELYMNSAADRWIHQTAHLTILLEDGGWDVTNPCIDSVDQRIESIFE